MSFHKVAQGFRLKGSEPRVTDLPTKTKIALSKHSGDLNTQAKKGEKSNLRISLKVSIVDRLDKLLGDFDYFLFASYNTELKKRVSWVLKLCHKCRCEGITQQSGVGSSL